MGQDVRKLELGAVALQAADLNLYLFDRSLHPELFRVYATHRVPQTRYVADVSIVGLGHVVTVAAGPRVATELITGESDLLPARGQLTRFRLKGERDLERRTAEGWHYMVSTQVEQMDEPLYKSVHLDLLKHATRRGWLQVYEQWGDGELIPFTFIDHEARDREFHIHAFHAFPAERTMVKTQSIFELTAT